MTSTLPRRFTAVLATPTDRLASDTTSAVPQRTAAI